MCVAEVRVVALWLAWACSNGPSDTQGANAPIVLAYGTRGEGEFEPCGCPERPLGGIARRAAMVERARAEGPVVVAEVGPSLHPLAEVVQGPVSEEQRRSKAALIVSEWQASGVDAVALGAADWKLGAEFVFRQMAAHQTPVLAANLTCDGLAPFPGHRVVERDGLSIGFVGATVGPVEGCDVSDMGEALRRARAQMPDVDVAIALVPNTTKADTLNAVLGKPPLDVDLLIDAHGRYTGNRPDLVGDIPAVGAGAEGKHVGFVAFSANGATGDWIVQSEGVEVPISNRSFRVWSEALDVALPEQPASAARVQAAKERIQQQLGADPRRFVPRIVPEPSPFAGGESCVSCHAEQHRQWSRTGHARAWNALVEVDRAFDDDCWGCHVTGHAAAGGPTDAPTSGPFRDVQCEACHGPSREHAQAPADVAPSGQPTLETCVACHDGVRDGGRFDAKTYLPKVVH